MIRSQRWTSINSINKNKYQLLVEIDKDNLRIKNEMSIFIFNHLQELLSSKNKYEFSSKYYKDFNSNYISSWCIQTIFNDIITFYQNLIDTYISNKDFKITSKFKINYYKKNVSKEGVIIHKKGSIKQFQIIKKHTELTKLIKYLTFINLDNIQNLKPELKQIYNYYIDKFGQQRILNLVKNIKFNILKRIKKPIQFTTGTYRVPYTTVKNYAYNYFIKDDSNTKYKYWFKLNLRKEYGDVYIPLQFNQKYNNFSSIQNKQFFIKTLYNKHKISIISTKNNPQFNFKQFKNSIGIDLNVKHNFCALSNNETIDYDRKYIKEFSTKLKKLDKIGLKNINDIQKKQLNKLVKRNQWYFKHLISDILDKLQQNQITDIVMQDLDLSKASYVYNQQFNIKYSRLIRLLRLSNIKNWFKEQAEKRGIKVHLTPSNYTSQQCSKCGFIDSQNRSSQQKFKCLNCGHEENADINAAKNILNRLENVSLRRSKLHKEDQYGRLIKNISNKFIIKNILESIYILQ